MLLRFSLLDCLLAEKNNKKENKNLVIKATSNGVVANEKRRQTLSFNEKNFLASTSFGFLLHRPIQEFK